MSSSHRNILHCATERRRCEDVYIMGRGVFVCVFACQGAGNAARHSLALGLARSIREPRLRGGYATSPARGGGRLAASSPADACAPFGFGFAKSSLRKLRFLRRISRQSPDCRAGASPSPCIPPPQAGSAKGGGIPRPAHSVSAEPRCGRRVGARGALRPLRALRFARGYPPLRSGAFPAPRIPAGRRVRMRRGLPSPGSVGIPPFAGSAASRLPPSAPPAVTVCASCRRPSSRSAHCWLPL